MTITQREERAVSTVVGYARVSTREQNPEAQAASRSDSSPAVAGSGSSAIQADTRAARSGITRLS
ncbi:MAG: hypothetical protein LBU50_07320 [Cellulomonas sp.]|jgi:DNA invertase Pin-like site-specific DNA recombinase|nr:hypothetical protein [Cellulomonas sp.]